MLKGLAMATKTLMFCLQAFTIIFFTLNYIIYIFFIKQALFLSDLSHNYDFITKHFIRLVCALINYANDFMDIKFNTFWPF